MNKKLAIGIININNLKYTKDCIDDLLKQNNNDFTITLVDQGSIEKGTKSYLREVEKHDNINVIRNKENISINKIYNEFTKNENSEYICILNNDVRLTDNYVDDTINILDNNPDVGIVAHTQNSWKYNKKLDDLVFKFTKRKSKQGTEFTIRKSLYVDIPSTLLFQCGDDWLFHHIYEKKFKVALCLSSPVIHFGSKSGKYAPMPYQQEEKELNKLGLKRYLPHYCEFNEVLPTFKNFGDEPIKTIIVLGISELNPNNDINSSFKNNNIIELNNEILNDIKLSTSLLSNSQQLLNISQYIKDTIKIKVSVEINKAIENNINYWGWDDPRTILSLPLFLEHIPNPNFIVLFNNNEEIAKYIISENPNILYENALKMAKNYNLRIIEFLFNWNNKLTS